MENKVKVAILGMHELGADLLERIQFAGKNLEVSAIVDFDSGLAYKTQSKEKELFITKNTDELIQLPIFKELKIIFDTTSNELALLNEKRIREIHSDIYYISTSWSGKEPFVPAINKNIDISKKSYNIITPSAQVSIPIIKSVSQIGKVHYAEVVTVISSLVADKESRLNIDDIILKTSQGIESLGGASKGRSILILNPAEPPILNRNTIYILSEKLSLSEIEKNIKEMIENVKVYLPGYRLKQNIQLDEINEDSPIQIPGLGLFSGLKIGIFLEVEAFSKSLPPYSGNLDILASVAKTLGERIAENINHSIKK